MRQDQRDYGRVMVALARAMGAALTPYDMTIVADAMLHASTQFHSLMRENDRLMTEGCQGARGDARTAIEEVR